MIRFTEEPIRSTATFSKLFGKLKKDVGSIDMNSAAPPPFKLVYLINIAKISKNLEYVRPLYATCIVVFKFLGKFFNKNWTISVLDLSPCST